MTCAIHLPNVKHIRSNIMKIKVPGYVTSKGSIMSRAFGWLGSFYEGGGQGNFDEVQFRIAKCGIVRECLVGVVDRPKLKKLRKPCPYRIGSVLGGRVCAGTNRGWMFTKRSERLTDYPSRTL